MSSHRGTAVREKSAGALGALVPAEENGTDRVFDSVIRTDHGYMRYIRCRILIAVYHIKFADFIFRTGHGIIHADQLRMLYIIRYVSAADSQDGTA